MQTIFMMIIMGVLFYFLLIRPQQRQRKELEKRVAALQKGDQVITSSGIYGMVHHIKERTTILKVAEATLIEFDKNAIATVLKKDSPAAADSK
ncbi:MAG: preprotein translocase, YajC subunit [Akkermansiaceae bacterium]|nr:preprotein translocase, YajC subunit [Akkermansiaceae bacterium]